MKSPSVKPDKTKQKQRVNPPKKRFPADTKNGNRIPQGTGDALQTLRDIAGDGDAPASARAAAARSLAEAEGLLGRHQLAPGAVVGGVPLASASRQELESELARLRLQYAAPNGTKA